MGFRLAAAWAGCFGLLAAAVAVSLFVMDAYLAPEDSAAFRRLLAESRWALLLLAVIAFASAGALANWLLRVRMSRVRRLAESTRLIAGGNPGHRIEADGPAELR